MGYINTDCIYKIIPKISTNKAIKVDKSKLTPVLDSKVYYDRSNDEHDDQNWRFEYNEKYQSYKIINQKYNKMIGYCDIDNADHLLMERLDLDSIYCHWIVEVTNDGYVILKNAGDAGNKKIDKVLDLRGSDKANGNSIILYERTNKDNQKFKLVRHKFVKGYEYKDAEKLKDPYVQKEHTYKNFEDLKLKIFKSEQFIKKWANIADMLGYRWCSGTRGVDIGEDFTVKRINSNKYVIEANHREKDPFYYGVSPKNRLVMEVTNIKLTFDPHSIKVSAPTITKLTPTVISTTNAVNNTKNEGTVSTEVEYTVGHTVSTSTSNSISNSIGVENSFKVKVHGMKFEQTFSYNITHDKTWGEQVDRTTESKLKSTYSTPVPSGKNVPIYALLYQSKANIPYRAKANLEYSIRFIGYLRDDNALKDKRKQREKTEYSFGDGKVSATKFLENEYSNRDVPGQKSGWDYIWSILNYNPEYFNKYMSQAITPDGVEISGIFTNISSTNVSIVAGKKADKDNYKVLYEKEITDTDIKEEVNPNIKEEIDVDIEIEKTKK